MTISFNGIKQFLTTDLTPNYISEILTDIGLEVESLEYIESIKGRLKGIIVGEILSISKHPNADKLKICKVHIGENINLQIICGAPNIMEAKKVAVATIGAILHTPSGEKFNIKKSKIRGVDSFGMICSEQELGLGNNHEGILTLDNKIKAGTQLNEIYRAETDAVFEIGLTPNRADAMSHYGVARDLYASLLFKKHKVVFSKINKELKPINKKESSFKVIIEDKNQCNRYAGILIENIRIAESPLWLKNKLKSIHLEPINNVVDATNYILHYYGQPLHVFDADHIHSKTIRIGNCKQDTTFTTLDKVERKLSSNDLMIKEGNNTPICIAGVFGGLSSGVTENTKNIFLESAYFNPIAVRKATKNHHLNTDASFKFERGIDPNLTVTFLIMAAKLICDIAGGELNENYIDEYPLPIKDFKIILRYSKINQILGQEIEQKTIKNILHSLDIEIIAESQTELTLKVPTYRNDVVREIDLIEEILRIYGYNTIALPDKISFSYKKTHPNTSLNIEKKIGNLLIHNGFYEVLNNSLVEKNESNNTIALLNPLSKELANMRTSLLNGLLQNIAYNNNRKQQNIKLFELGTTYFKEKKYNEIKILSLAITGDFYEKNWISTKNTVTFFHLKGILKLLFESMNIIKLEEKPIENEEGIFFLLKNKIIGKILKLTKEKLNKYSINQEVFYAEVYWDECIKLIPTSHKPFVEIPKFPSIKRDLALVLDKKINYYDLYQTAFNLNDSLLKKINLFDVYEGKNIPKGKKSYALSFEIQDENKTLTDKQIDKVMHKLIKEFTEIFKAELRN